MKRTREPGSEPLRQAIGYGVRRLLRRPAFTLPALASIGLGMGALLALLNVFDRVAVRPLPYPEAPRLVRLSLAVPGVGPDARWGLGRPQFHYYRAQARTLDALGLYILTAAPVASPRAGPEPPEEARVAAVSASLQDVLGVRPALGRPLGPDDQMPERPQVVLLSHAFWMRAYGGRPEIVGRSIQISGRPLQVVGVLPAEARLPEELQSPSEPPVSLWVPLHLDPAEPPTGGGHVFRSVARLRPGATPEAALLELEELTRRLPQALPGTYPPEFMSQYGIAPLVAPLRDDVLGGAARLLRILLGAGAVLFLLAVVNVTSLTLGEMEARRGELGIRAALGADAGGLARLLWAEAALLAAAGGAAALAVAAVANRLLLWLAPSFVPRLSEARLGWREVGLALLLAALSGVVMAASAATHLRRHGGPLHDGGRARGHGLRRGPRGVLVAAQLALSLVLLAGAGLLLASFRHLTAVDPGFDPRGVLTLRLVLPPAEVETTERAAGVLERVSARLHAIPGVTAVGMTSSLPLTGFDGCSTLFVEGARNPAEPPCVPIHVVTPGYLQALRARVRGAEPAWPEVRSGAGSIVVTRALAERLWPGVDPIGRRVKTGADAPALSVGGVVGELRLDGLDRPASEAAFIPVLPGAAILPVMGGPPRQLSVAVRSNRSDPALLAPEVRAALAEVAPGTAVADVRPLRELVSASHEVVTVTGLLLALACLVAVVVSAVGLYGVVSSLVTLRWSELGIRMALGAERSTVGRAVLADSLKVAALGLAVGIPLALAGTRLLGSLLFGVTPADPTVFAAAGIGLLLVAVAAGLVPAARAMRADPAELLRHP